MTISRNKSLYPNILFLLVRIHKIMNRIQLFLLVCIRKLCKNHCLAISRLFHIILKILNNIFITFFLQPNHYLDMKITNNTVTNSIQNCIPIMNFKIFIQGCTKMIYIINVCICTPIILILLSFNMVSFIYNQTINFIFIRKNRK